MGTFNTVDINILALTILFIIYLNLTHKSDKYILELRLFISLIVSTAALLILELMYKDKKKQRVKTLVQ